MGVNVSHVSFNITSTLKISVVVKVRGESAVRSMVMCCVTSVFAMNACRRWHGLLTHVQERRLDIGYGALHF